MKNEKYLKQFLQLKNASAPDPDSRVYERFASEMEQVFSVDHWTSVCAVTLTLRQAIRPDDGKREWLDPMKAEKNFQSFINRLNRAVFGNAVRRHGKRVRVISSVEKEADSRFHIHAAIEAPKHVTQDEFRALIERCWSETTWGYNRNSVDFGADQGWVDYMLKPSQKSGLEAWSDCIGWNSFHNPNC